MKRTILTIATLSGLCLLAGDASGGSIWDRASRAQQHVYADDIARDVGDILTIVIQERHKTTSDTSRDLSKSDSRSAEITGKLKLLDEIDDWTGGFFKGESEFESAESVTDQITVVVEDVLPNGNLVVLGKRTRETGDNRQIILVSGIVRGSDINYQNTIASDRIANFSIVVKRTGPENRFTRPGWLAQILNFLNPF